VACYRHLSNLYRESSLQCGVVFDGFERELSLKRASLAEPQHDPPFLGLLLVIIVNFVRHCINSADEGSSNMLHSFPD
jgi:hypothetical protein